MMPFVDAQIMTYSPNFNYRSQIGGGNIRFSDSFTAAYHTYDTTDNLIKFYSFNLNNLVSEVGFSCPSTMNMTINKFTEKELSLTVTGTSTVYPKIYLPGYPIQWISGVDTFNASSTGLVSLTVTPESGSASVVISFASDSGGSSGPLPIITPIVVPAQLQTFWAQYGVLIIVGVFGVAVIYSLIPKTANEYKNGLLGSLGVDKEFKSWGKSLKKLRKDVWDED